MQELIGATATNYRKCAVTEECMGRMLQLGHSEYTITHQLLYTLLAEEVGVGYFYVFANVKKNIYVRRVPTPTAREFRKIWNFSILQGGQDLGGDLFEY